MVQLNWMEILLRVLCLVAALAFVVRYLSRLWYTTPHGRHLMAFTVVVTEFLALVVLAIYINSPDTYRIIANILFLQFLFVLVQRNLLLKKDEQQGLPESFTTVFADTKENFVDYVKWVLKAIYAGVAAAVAGVVIALTPDSQLGLSEITTLEKWLIVASVVAAVGGVFGLDNGPKPLSRDAQDAAAERVKRL